jgi:hypothetical protein
VDLLSVLCLCCASIDYDGWSVGAYCSTPLQKTFRAPDPNLHQDPVEQTGQPLALSEHSVSVQGPGVQGKAAMHASQDANLQPVPVSSPESVLVGVVQKQVIQPNVFLEQVHLLQVG